MAWAKTLEKNRAAGVIVNNVKMLLIHRIRDGREYWVLPGGSIEEGETVEEALDREMAEELGIQVQAKHYLFEIQNLGRVEYFYLISKYKSEPRIGGPELARMNEQNQYILEEVDIDQISKINFLPKECLNLLLESVE